MAEPELTSLSALVDPPLAEAPAVAELERRADRARRRRRAGRGAGLAAVVALVAGTVALSQPDGGQTLRTAAPPPAGGSASPAGGSGAGAGVGARAPFHEFEAGGQAWQLAFADGAGPCVEVRGASTTRTGICWDGGPLMGTGLEVGGVMHLLGMADGDVTEVSTGPARPADVVPIVASGPGGERVFFKPVPEFPATLALVAATAADPRAHTRTVTLHGRVAGSNGREMAAPPPPSTTATTRAPTTTPSVAPSPPNPDVPVSTVVPSPPPTTTAPPSAGNPQRVSVTPGATSLRKHAFESAFASGASSLAVRFWDGVEPCSVLGRVDVVESADKVTITLWTGIGPGAEAMSCIALAVHKETIVPLSAPLGFRTVVDGAA